MALVCNHNPESSHTRRSVPLSHCHLARSRQYPRGKVNQSVSVPRTLKIFLLDLSSMPPERSPLEDGDFMNSPAFLFFFFFPFFSFPLSYYCYCYSTFWCFVLLFYHFYTPGIFTLFFKTCLAASTVGNRELLIDPPQSVERIKKKNRSSERKTHQPTN